MKKGIMLFAVAMIFASLVMGVKHTTAVAVYDTPGPMSISIHS